MRWKKPVRNSFPKMVAVSGYIANLENEGGPTASDEVP